MILTVCVFAFIFGTFGLILGLMYMLKSDLLWEFIEKSAKDLLESAATNENLQKNIYIIGGTLGSGLKGGVGLNIGPKSSKFRWQDLAGELLGQFLQGNLKIPSPSPGPSPSSQTINSQKPSDKW